MINIRPYVSIFGFATSLAFLGATIALAISGQNGGKSSEGEALFKQKCAPCHGRKGEGGPGYSRRLVGTRSISELAKFISQQMPPGKVKCTAADSQKIAPFIFNSFYSPIAQERNRPARISLQRLTVTQVRNAVADLVSLPHAINPSEPPSGIYGEYFTGRNLDSKSRVFKRIDQEVNFDFGIQPPAKDGFDPRLFSIAWQGDVLAPDTGEYEFVIHSDQSVQLWVNGWKQPLIDGTVRSNNSNELKGTIYLLGGRAYPLRLTFIKASQGVDDTAQKKAKPPGKSSISLLWIRPNHALETVPSNCLYTQTDYPTFVLTTRFPPDDRSTGYERGNSVSREWDEAVTSAALEAASYIASNMAAVSGVADNAPNRKALLKDYCRKFIRKAFRRVVSPEVEQSYIEKQFSVAKNEETAVKRVVLMALKSPRFLFREIGRETDQRPEEKAYAIASQLSFGLWDSLPDQELEHLASTGELLKTDVVRLQAERMSADPRSWIKLRQFLLHWLKVDEVPDLVKDAKHYPGFDSSLASDLRTSLELFLQNTAWSNKSSFEDLMLSPSMYMNGRLAKFYGASLPESAPFQLVEIDRGKRAGVLTQPYLLTRFAYLDASSPIHRGVLIVRNYLGRILQPPPAAFAPLAASLHPELTTRQRVALQTRPDFCAGCHSLINPLGFTLEEFDAAGRVRASDNGRPVDCSGNYRAANGKLAEFRSAIDLAKYIATSEEAHSAFVEKLFQHMIKQPALAYGANTLPDLNSTFKESGYSIRKLLPKIVLRTLAAADSTNNKVQVPKR